MKGVKEIEYENDKDGCYFFGFHDMLDMLGLHNRK